MAPPGAWHPPHSSAYVPVGECPLPPQGTAITLGFLVSVGRRLMWHGRWPLDHWLAAVHRRAPRREITLAFGGPCGRDLASEEHDPNRLADAYVEAASMYGAACLDFVIWPVDAPAEERRSAALCRARSKMPGLRVQYTYLLHPPASIPPVVDTLNIMLARFGDAHDPEGAVQTAVRLRALLGRSPVGVGITPMMDDDTDIEAHALAFAAFAARNGRWLRFVGCWADDSHVPLLLKKRERVPGISPC